MNKKPLTGRIFIGRFDAGDDLLRSLRFFCEKQNIHAGVFWLIGAVKSVSLGYYNQSKKKYANCLKLRKKLEISSCQGNISLKNKDIFVHAHILLSDLKGKTIGGHLLQGTEVFACEYYIQEIKNISLKREKDRITGLFLWKNIEQC